MAFDIGVLGKALYASIVEYEVLATDLLLDPREEGHILGELVLPRTPVRFVVPCRRSEFLEASVEVDDAAHRPVSQRVGVHPTARENLTHVGVDPEVLDRHGLSRPEMAPLLT